MPKKCPALYSSTSHKRQRSEKKSVNNKKHSYKSADSCHSAKPIQKHRGKDQSSGSYRKNAPSCNPELFFQINCSADSAHIPCGCNRRALERQCSAVNPTTYCPSREKTFRSDEGLGNECCCGVPRKKEKLNLEKRERRVKTARDCKSAKELKPGKSRKEQKNCEPEEEVELRNQSADCWESSLKQDRKKLRDSCSKLLCCSCFKTLWKKKKKRKRRTSTAPCKRYLCLHNPGRSECDEAIPCDKCTHNCGPRIVEASGKELPETVIKPCPKSSAKTLASLKPTKSNCEASGYEKPIGIIKTKEKCETNEIADLFPEKKCTSTKDRKRSHEEKKRGENTRKSRKKKSCQESKKQKKPQLECPTPTAGTSSTEYRCCPCKIPGAEMQPKTKPCMKCPEKMLGAKSSCKKLTFASCTDLRDYKLENTENIEKKRGVMGIVFDVIFWPYVFWPRRSDPCK